MMESFQHQPLVGRNSTRLLKLSAFGGESLRCSVFEISLDRPPSYEAISYTWAGENRHRSITCDGKVLNITPSCEAALRRLRHRLMPRLLWVDVISIDQTSHEEIGHQVGLMHEIYSKARRTLVWLGEGTESSDAAFELMGYLFLLPILPKDFADNLADMQLLRKKGDTTPAYDKKVLQEALEALFGRTWFERTWTLQEAALAPRTLLICGGKDLDWDALQLAMKLLVQRHEENPYMLSPSIYVSRTATHRDISRAVKIKLKRPLIEKVSAYWRPYTYSQLLSEVRRTRSTDDRDKIFAIAGLLKILELPVVEPDYSSAVSTEDVYIAAARLAIEHDRDLSILYEIGARKYTTMPSWVPDWSQTFPPVVGHMSLFSAAGGTEQYYHFSTDQMRLVCHGRHVDTISNVSALALGYATGDERGVHEPLQEWTEMVLGLAAYPNGEDVLTAFGRTLIKDTFEEAIRTDNAYSEAVRNLFQQTAQPPKQPALPYVEAFKAWHAFFMAVDNNHDNAHDQLGDDPGGPASASAEMLASHFRDEAATLPADFLSYHRHVMLASGGHSLFTTQRGYMGTTHPGVRAGDVVVLLAGLHVPFIMRPVSDGAGSFQLINHAYIHGIMYGEAMTEDYSDEEEEEEEEDEEGNEDDEDQGEEEDMEEQVGNGNEEAGLEEDGSEHNEAEAEEDDEDEEEEAWEDIDSSDEEADTEEARNRPWLPTIDEGLAWYEQDMLIRRRIVEIELI